MKQSVHLPAILGGRPAFAETVPITSPTLPRLSKLKDKYEEVLKSGMITNAKFVQEFENRVARYIPARHAVAVSSCTSGLILIIKALGLKGEVILPSFTFHATAHAVIWNGLEPVFVDCDRQTFNLDPEKVKKAITADTSAIIGVHIFGNPAEARALEQLARKNGLKLIFDAAHAFGARYKGKNIGSFGDAESFSLSPTKLVTAGEGGIVSTNNPALAQKIRVGRNYGDPGTYDCDFSGLNARMSEFNAIVALASLDELKSSVLRRNRIARLYRQLLADIPGIGFQVIKEGNRSSYKDFCILVDKEKFGMDRDTLSEALLAENIMVKKYFYPALHQQKVFKKFSLNGKEGFANTEAISANALSLPLYSHIAVDAVERICAALKNIYSLRRKIKRQG